MEHELLLDTHKMTAEEAIAAIVELEGVKEEFEQIHAHESNHPKKPRKTILNALEEIIGEFEVEDPAEGLARESVATSSAGGYADTQFIDPIATVMFPEVVADEYREFISDPPPVYEPPEDDPAQAIVGGIVHVVDANGMVHEGVVIRDALVEERPVVVMLKDGHDTQLLVRLDVTGLTPLSWRLPG